MVRKKGVNMSREEEEQKQWKIIAPARDELLKWAKKEKIPLFRVDLLPVPGIALQVFAYFRTENELKLAKEKGQFESIRQKYLSLLKIQNYMKLFGKKVFFAFDSDQNIQEKYKGNYGSRMR